MRRNVLVSSTSSLVNGPPYLFFPSSIQLEGTAMLRDLVLPRVLEHIVDILEWIQTCFLYVQVLSQCKNNLINTAATMDVIVMHTGTNIILSLLPFIASLSASSWRNPMPQVYINTNLPTF